MPGKSSVASSSFFNQSEDAKASGFSNAIQSPWHLFTAKLFAYAKPVFLLNSITLNLLSNSGIFSKELSVDPLSMIMHSKSEYV